MKLHAFTVRPSLPPRLRPLMDIAKNIYWTWRHEAIQLFQRIDLDLWESTGHNPMQMLGEISQERFDELVTDESFMAHMEDVAIELGDYIERSTWFADHKGDKDLKICYFSAEFGLHESLPLYSGGLGLLAGDHLKSASDLGMPLVAMGLLYRQGYFQQYLNHEGWQQETYPENDYATMPVDLLKDENDKPLSFIVNFPDRGVKVHIWKIQVGRIELFLLDTNLPENRAEDREITSQLYGGDQEMRIKQEIILGIGGVKALRVLGIRPTVYHMNEGHSAFMSLERIKSLIETEQMGVAEALEIVISSNVFTTHTPVPAGNDAFPPEMVDKYLQHYYGKIGLARDQFMGLGRQNPFDRNEEFNMTVLAMRLSAHRNGVSELHGQVSRKMWSQIWPGLFLDEVPIDHVTNGVHTAGWTSHEMGQLYTRYLGPRWSTNPEKEKVWARVERIPDAELWRTHERRRERLVAFARSRLVAQLTARGAAGSEIDRAREVLDPEVLTIGFARRFATYKRGALLFTDPERLSKILNNKDRPVQIIFAGKAHPKDNLGKEVIKKIVQIAREPEFRDRIVFVENYDINVAHYLVQGVDIWINNPRRPLEASGTSGMKVSANGGLNLSILDGWWVEAYDGTNGWSIGSGEEYEDHEYQDMVEIRALYDILEKEVAPAYYKRGTDGIPREWTALMKNNLKTICPAFNTNRMMIDYYKKFYQHGSESKKILIADDKKAAKELAHWKNSIRNRWAQIEIVNVDMETSKAFHVGDKIEVNVKIRMSEVSPEEIKVEIYHAKINSKGEMDDGLSILIPFEKDNGDGTFQFKAAIPLKIAGRRGMGVRVLPYHKLMVENFIPGLVLWA